MLKVRVLPTLLYKELGLVKGIKFDSWRRVGSLIQSVKVYNLRDVDELAFFDISATHENRSPDFELVDEFADECFMPLTVGGGIKSVDDVRNLLRVGADKVSINSAAIEKPELVKEAVSNFGSQCVMVSIDAKQSTQGRYKVHIESGTKPTNIDVLDHAKYMESLGAGEILITSIERDGTMKGYDLDLIKSLTSALHIPVIASGGAGTYQHMTDAIKIGKASAVAAASMFHFTEQTPLEAKKFLKMNGISTRL